MVPASDAFSRSAGPPAIRGREAELARLVRYLDDGRGRIVTIHGEAGIGKTRLVQAAAAEAERRGWRSTWGRWYEGAGQLPYSGAITAMRRLNAVSPAADLLSAVGGASSTPETRQALWEKAEQLIGSSSYISPVFGVLDDFHWADVDTLEMLGHVASALIRAPLLICVLFRDHEASNNGHLQTFRRRLRDAGADDIQLGPIPFSATVALVRDMTERRWSLPALRRLHEVTRGNPLFMQEMVRGSENGRAGPPDLDSQVSPEIEEVMARRFAGLSPASLELVRLISVLGREFEIQTLEEFGGLLSRDLGAAVREACRAGVLVEHEQGHLSFAHPLMRSVLYQGIDPLARSRLHGQVAERLEPLLAGRPEGPVELGYHYLRSNRQDHVRRGIEFLVEAARHATSVYAPFTAHGLWRDALAAGEHAGVDAARLNAWYHEFGIVAGTAGAPEEALAAYERALSYYEQVGDQAMVAELNARIGWHMTVWGRRTGALPYLEKALPVLRALPSARNAELLAQYAISLANAGRLEDGREFVDSALAMAAAVGGDETVGVVSHLAAIWHTWAPGDAARVAGLYRAARQGQARLSEQPICRVLADQAMSQLVMGRLPAAERTLDRASELCSRHQYPSAEADVHVLRSQLLVMRGRWQESEREADACRDYVRAGVPVYGESMARAQALRWYWQGDLARAEQELLFVPSFLVASVLPLLRVAQGRTEEAESILQSVLPHLPHGGRGGVWMMFALGCAAALEALGRPEEAAPWYPSMVRQRRWLFDWFVADIQLGVIAAADHRWPQALDHLQAAIAFCDRLDFAPFGAIARARLARVYADRARPGDRQRARALVEDAIERFHVLGMATELRTAQQLRSRLRRGRPQTADGEGLSPRQRQILSLVAAGRSNREIAEMIGLGVRTVDYHVVAILSKLNVRTRAAAVAKAGKDGLV